MFETRETVWHLAHLVDNYVVAVEEETEHFDKAEIKGLEREIVAGRCQRGYQPWLVQSPSQTLPVCLHAVHHLELVLCACYTCSRGSPPITAPILHAAFFGVLTPQSCLLKETK